MGADKANIQTSHPKMNHRNKPVLVSLHIEHVSVIFNVINSIEILPDVS